MKTAPWPGFVTTNSSRNLDLLLLFDQVPLLPCVCL